MFLAIYYVYMTGSDVAIIIFVVCCIVYYICIKTESMRRVHPALYFCILGMVLIVIINAMILAIVTMDITILIVFEVTYCIMFGFPLLSKIMDVTGRGGDLYWDF